MDDTYPEVLTRGDFQCIGQVADALLTQGAHLGLFDLAELIEPAAAITEPQLTRLPTVAQQGHQHQLLMITADGVKPGLVQQAQAGQIVLPAIGEIAQSDQT